MVMREEVVVIENLKRLRCDATMGAPLGTHRDGDGIHL